jgi:hypothetical protein
MGGSSTCVRTVSKSSVKSIAEKQNRDEADVFLESRTRDGDANRNALVSGIDEPQFLVVGF